MFSGAYNGQTICPLWATAMKNEFSLFSLMGISRYVCLVTFNEKEKERVVG